MLESDEEDSISVGVISRSEDDMSSEDVRSVLILLEHYKIELTSVLPKV